jgi:hypothetical protein
MTDRDPRPESVTMVLESDGTRRPVAELLEERKAYFRERPAAEREQALRVRMGMAATIEHAPSATGRATTLTTVRARARSVSSG